MQNSSPSKPLISSGKGILKATGTLDRTIYHISRISGVIAIVFLLAMMLLTVSDITLRYFFRCPIPGTLELTEFFMIIAGFLGMAWCAIKGEHVKVDMLVNRLPRRVQLIIESVTMLLSIGIAPLVIWRNFIQSKISYIDHSVSNVLNIPEYPFYFIVCLGYALLLLVMITILVKNLRMLIKK